MNYDGPEFEDEEGDEGSRRPHGMRPHGLRPHGMRPHGMRPHGMRPHGMRPHGMRPHGMRTDSEAAGGGGLLDPEEWSADIAELVCERSAVIRLGATLVAGDDDVPVQAFAPAPGFRPPGVAAPPPAVAAPAGPFRPGDWRLEAGVNVLPELLRSMAVSPELADAVKADLAEGLATLADLTFLQGPGPPAGPLGIAARVPAMAPGIDPLDTARQLITALRPAVAPQAFRNPGWILSPNTLDALTGLVTADGMIAGGVGARSLDSYRLLRLDGTDGGVFLGVPFVASPGAGPNLYLAADWQEAWVGVDPSFVSVHISTALPPAGRGVVISASLPLDFTLRRNAAFAWA